MLCRACAKIALKRHGIGLGGRPIHINRLKLTSFRNYEALELHLKPGMAFFYGGNGQGKSNLLEAIYVLAIAKSPRALNDREMVRWQAANEQGYCQVLALVQRDHEPLKIQMDIRYLPPGQEGAGTDEKKTRQGTWDVSVQKQFRVNGIPRTASDLVGELNAVMFSAQDLDLVLGSPVERRRFMDTLISQVDRRYLRALQKYQRVLYQRNHLLRMIREGRAGDDELAFWDQQLTAEGAYIMAQRLEMVEHVSSMALPIHDTLTGDGESLQVRYQPRVGIGKGTSLEEISQRFQEILDRDKREEIARGVSRNGPHRDDLQLLIGGMDAGLYASRGQARTVALALRLAEARYLSQRRGQEPILLLDDVLSELDSVRRSRVLQAASQFEQSLITATDLDTIEELFLSTAAKFRVQSDHVESD